MTNRDIEFQTLEIPYDSRIIDLIQTMGMFSQKRNLEIILSKTGNLYLRGIVKLDEAGSKAENYFNEHKLYAYMNEELSSVAPAASICIKHCTRFEDGVVQFCGLGEPWESIHGYCWGLYGHIVSEKKQ